MHVGILRQVVFALLALVLVSARTVLCGCGFPPKACYLLNLVG